MRHYHLFDVFLFSFCREKKTTKEDVLQTSLNETDGREMVRVKALNATNTIDILNNERREKIS